MSGLADRSAPAAALEAHARLSADQIIAGLDTKADQIRALAQAGYLRTEIASLMNIRYQHVRQVLERSGIYLGRSRDGGPPPRMMRQPSPPRGASAISPAEPLIDVGRLIAAGFVLIGQWTAVDDTAFVLNCIAPTTPGVYVFVVDGIIRYIGLTQRGLRGRMGHYVRGHSRQRTSARVKALILEALAAGSRVEILIATPDPLEWNGLPVNTAPGLEAGLIRLIKPDWNMQGVGR